LRYSKAKEIGLEPDWSVILAVRRTSCCRCLISSGVLIKLSGAPANDTLPVLGRGCGLVAWRSGEIMRTTVLLAFLSALAVPAVAMDHHGTVQADGLTWAAPAAYAAGAQLAVVKGDPTREGQYVVRLKVPAGYKIAAHTHPNDENVTVLSGTFNIGTGDKLDDTKGVLVKAGGYSYVAKGMTHQAWFTEETVLQLHGIGPQGHHIRQSRRRSAEKVAGARPRVADSGPSSDRTATMSHPVLS
jgi:quercetin dioxygenase-like cupin family protein